MKRRDVLKAAGIGIAGSTALAIPAVAQSMPELRWRMASSFPKSLGCVDKWDSRPISLDSKA